jgi:ubiquinol-cytochrome c reductase cytochrome c subunit
VIPSPPPAIVQAGHTAYQQACASCHGADLRGSVNAPSLRGVGAADVDFWVGTGRMPAAVPWIQVEHRGAQLPQGTIDAIVAYVTSVQPGGEPIPQVAAGGDLRHGRALYEQNCQHCHGVAATGASIGGADWAPSLHRATITQVAEAIRVGPGNMPRFGARQIDAPALDDVASYVISLDDQSARRAIPLRTSGPVPEGLLGWLAVGLLCALAYAFSRSHAS